MDFLYFTSRVRGRLTFDRAISFIFFSTTGTASKISSCWLAVEGECTLRLHDISLFGAVGVDDILLETGGDLRGEVSIDADKSLLMFETSGDTYISKQLISSINGVKFKSFFIGAVY